MEKPRFISNIFHKITRPFVTAKASLTGRYKTWKLNRDVEKMKKKRRAQTATVESEIEMITESLIEEVIGDKGILDLQFQVLMQPYKDESRPMGTYEAEEIIRSLLKEAVAKRGVMIGRIEKNIEDGPLYDRYYGKISVINDLTDRTYSKLQLMQIWQERFEYLKQVRDKVISKEYIEAVRPDDKNQIDNGIANTGTNDIWEKISKAGGS